MKTEKTVATEYYFLININPVTKEFSLTAFDDIDEALAVLEELNSYHTGNTYYVADVDAAHDICEQYGKPFIY